MLHVCALRIRVVTLVGHIGNIYTTRRLIDSAGSLLISAVPVGATGNAPCTMFVAFWENAMRIRLALMVITFLAVLMPVADAQYFGRNMTAHVNRGL